MYFRPRLTGANILFSQALLERCSDLLSIFRKMPRFLSFPIGLIQSYWTAVVQPAASPRFRPRPVPASRSNQTKSLKKDFSSLENCCPLPPTRRPRSNQNILHEVSSCSAFYRISLLQHYFLMASVLFFWLGFGTNSGCSARIAIPGSYLTVPRLRGTAELD